MRAGIENVYRAAVMDGFFRRRIRSVLSTVFFILIIVAAAAVMLFGDFLLKLIPKDFTDAFFSLRTPFFIIIMTAVFTAVYTSVAKRSRIMPKRILAHLPGALITSLGWVVFSMIYSYYIDNFPRASAVYGSLAAVCLIMLWLYFCMVILLYGAVINKLRTTVTDQFKESAK